jgi:hypothetical protein
MLPELDGYRIVEEEALLEHITGLADGAARLAGQPELAVAIAAADEVIGCYVDVGAVQARVYSDLSMPLSAGVVAIADRNALLDPANLFACVGPLAPDPTAGLPEFELCKASYTLTKDDNEFYIIYAGTTAEICQAFCAQLEGCEAQ